jgi:hypothetical protein|tara:strand:+ start:3536 stop:3670 length:135 start_codon:yes stop_codon:yes gene_type:complete
VGAVIFVAYIIVFIWDIDYSAKRRKEENSGYYSRHNEPEKDEPK